MKTRICNKCGEEKPQVYFRRYAEGYCKSQDVRPLCADCHNQQTANIHSAAQQEVIQLLGAQLRWGEPWTEVELDQLVHYRKIVGLSGKEIAVVMQRTLFSVRKQISLLKKAGKFS